MIGGEREIWGESGNISHQHPGGEKILFPLSKYFHKRKKKFDSAKKLCGSR